MRAVLFLMAIILIGCSSKPENQKRVSIQSNDTTLLKVKKSAIKYSLDTTVNVGYGFEISCKQDEFSESSNNDALLIVKHNNKQVYIDKSNYYVFDDSLNPTMLVFGNDLFELFLEVDNRPNKNFLKMLKIQSDNVIDSQVVPAFSYRPCHLFDDTTIVYADFFDFAEEWTDSNNKNWITSDPIMYYKLSKKGLVLDSFHTIIKNKEIFGIANVFNEREFKSIPINKDGAKKREIERIMNCR